MDSIHTIFRSCRLQPYLGLSGLKSGEDGLELQAVAQGQPLKLSLEVLPAEEWGPSTRKEFVTAFENNSAQIGFSYSLVSGKRTLIKQDFPFEFDYGNEEDDGSPKVRVSPNGDSLTFSMIIQIDVNDEFLRQPLRLLFTLNYFMETFGLSSNQLQMEAERRSSSIDPDRNDHLRGYIGVDEEEFRVRQLMEFNRFRPTKVPPKEAELCIEVVKPLTITSTCEELSPGSTMLTLSIQNSYPGATVYLQRVTIHANETIKGATLLRGDPERETEDAAIIDEEAKSRRSRYNSREGQGKSERGLMSIRDDLLHGGEGEQLLEVDLSDDGEGADGEKDKIGMKNGSGGDRDEEHGSGRDSARGEESAASESAYSMEGASEIERGAATESGHDQLDEESAYVMQVRGRPLDVSGLFTFTALDRLSAREDVPVRVVPPGGTCTVRYRVEPREARGPHPYLHSSLLVGDFFSPISVVWSTATDISSDSGTTSETSVRGSLSPSGTSVGKHVTYWSMGKRWANLCCFEEVSMPAGQGAGIDGVAASRRGTPARARPVPASPAAHLCLGNQIGEGSPLKSPYSGYLTPSLGPGAAAGLGSPASLAAGTITVMTPSRRQGQVGGGGPTGSDQEGAFVLTMRGPAFVEVQSAFEVHVEVANRSSRTISNLSLQVPSSRTPGEQEVPYVVHESCTTFGEVLRPGQSLKLALHVFPLVAGPLKLNGLTLVEHGDGRGQQGHEQEVEVRYEFLQFFSCFVTSKGA